jgi:S1-C subfamily serine protease
LQINNEIMKRVIIFCVVWMLAAGAWAGSWVDYPKVSTQSAINLPVDPLGDPGTNSGMTALDETATLNPLWIFTSGIMQENILAPSFEPSARFSNDVDKATLQKCLLDYRISESVFTIKTFNRAGNLTGIASAVVLQPGIAITCFHVIGDSWRVTGVLGNGKVVDFVAYMPPMLNHDVCLMRYEPSTVGGVICFAATERATVGDKVYTIGAPEGLGHTLGEGIISAFREVSGYGMTIQITAPISRGSSGGLLLDRRTYFLGIIAFMWKEGQNLNFAIPNDVILAEFKYLKAHPEAMISFPYWRK